MTRHPISSGADPVLRRCCDRVASLGGRIIAGLLDDVLISIQRDRKEPRKAIEDALLTFGEVDPARLRATGATIWPPAVQVVPARTAPSPASPARTSAALPGPAVRSFGMGRAA